MRIDNLIELMQKLFYSDFENCYIVDTGERETRKASDMSLEDLISYDISEIEGIVLEDGYFYIKF